MRRCAVDATTQNVEPADAPGEFTQGDGQKSGAAGDVRGLGRSPLHRHRVPDHLETIPGHRLGLERAGTASRGTMCAMFIWPNPWSCCRSSADRRRPARRWLEDTHEPAATTGDESRGPVGPRLAEAPCRSRSPSKASSTTPWVRPGTRAELPRPFRCLRIEHPTGSVDWAGPGHRSARVVRLQGQR